MKISRSKSRPLRILSLHLPLLGVLSILAYLTLLNTHVLERFQSEQTYALMLVVWMPLGILLGMIQLYFWVKWFIRGASPFSRKVVKMGFMIIFAIFVFFAALRYLY